MKSPSPSLTESGMSASLLSLSSRAGGGGDVESSWRCDCPPVSSVVVSDVADVLTEREAVP